MFFKEFEDFLDVFDYKFTKLFKAHGSLLMLMKKNENPVFRGQQFIMMILAKHNGCTQKELADMIGVKPASITCALKRMEKIGLVIRKPDENDMRITRVYSTVPEKEKIDEIRKISSKVTDVALKNFTEDEKNSFMNFLDRVTDNILEYLEENDNNEKTDKIHKTI